MADGVRLITGATDGLGLALARRWSARGARLVLHGRRPARAFAAGHLPSAPYLCADLAEPRAPEELVAALDALGVTRLERLVLNAAEGWVGNLVELPEARARRLLEVDLFASLRLVHLLLPRLAAARGRIVFVSSLAARLAAPRYAVYAAAKAAAEGFFRSLALELAGEVEVQILRPGAVRTRLHEKCGFEPGARAARWPTAEQVARELERRIDGPARDATLGLANRGLAELARVLPAVVDRMATQPPIPARAGASARPNAPRVLVTGAAAGIGRELARAWAGSARALVLCDVDRAGLERLAPELERAGSSVSCVAADLATPAGRAELALRLRAGEPLDVALHNAGISATGRFAHLPWQEQRRVLELNLVAPLVLTAELLGAGGLAAGGSVVFVSSLSRFVGYPGASVYAASKDGLAHFARSLRAHLRGAGGHVLTVYPGPTRTEHARRHGPPGAREERRMPPEELAARIFAAVLARQDTLVPGWTNRAAATFGLLCPGLAGRAMRRIMLPAPT